MILGALHDAADRGVHIRLLVDGMESWIDMEGNPYFYGLSSHENVEIKLYNKANPLKPWKMMGRMHDKYLIADGKRYIPVSYTHLDVYKRQALHRRHFVQPSVASRSTS